MRAESNFVEPYKPSQLHTIHHWFDRLPGPYWLYSVILMVLAGFLNHVVAWKKNALSFGEVNVYFALTAFYFCYYLFGTDFLFRAARDSLMEFRPILKVKDDQFDRILFEFTHLPALTTSIVFLLGAAIGVGLALQLLPTAPPEMNTAFPEMEITLYALTIGIAFVVLYMIPRTLRQINLLFERVEKIDIFDQNSIYAISRFSAWLIVIVTLPISLTRILAPGFTTGANSLVSSLIGFYVVLCAVLFIGFWVPLRGINRKLTLEKRRLLVDVNNQIKTMIDRVGSKIKRRVFNNFVDLKDALESLKIEKDIIEALPTAPWRAGTVTGLLTAIFVPFLVGLLINLASSLLNF